MVHEIERVEDTYYITLRLSLLRLFLVPLKMKSEDLPH